MQKYLDLKGQKYGKLLVIERYDNIGRKIRWKCLCDCGNYSITLTDSLRRKTRPARSCGCIKREALEKANKKTNKYIEFEDYVIGITNNGQEFIFDKEDYHTIKKYCWHIGSNNYIVAYHSINKNISLHKLILGEKDDMIIDHINGNKFDNRKCNLRFCNASQNAINSFRKNRKYSTKTGVTYDISRRKWVANLKYNKQNFKIGRYDTEEEAISARELFENKICGEFIRR